MKRLALAATVAGLLLLPGVARASSATDAALGLGAFAVFNQILSGTGIFGGVVARPVVVAPRPVVVAPPVYAPVPVYRDHIYHRAYGHRWGWDHRYDHRYDHRH